MSGDLSRHAEKNSVNTTIGGVGMLFSPRAIKPLNNKEKSQLKIMCAIFDDNSRTTIATVSPISVMKWISSLYMIINYFPFAQYIRKYNAVIGGNMNLNIDKYENDKFTVHHNLPNRNGEYLTNFSLENTLSCLNTKFQKRERTLWTYTNPNNAKALIDCIVINKKKINSSLKCEAYSSFEGYLPIKESSQQRFAWVYAEIKKKTSKPHVTTGPHLPIETLAINLW